MNQTYKSTFCLRSFRKAAMTAERKIKTSIAASHTFTPLRGGGAAERETPMMLCSAAVGRVTRGSRGALVTAALIASVTAEVGEPCEVHHDGVNYHFLLRKTNKNKHCCRWKHGR